MKTNLCYFKTGKVVLRYVFIKPACRSLLKSESCFFNQVQTYFVFSPGARRISYLHQSQAVATVRSLPICASFVVVFNIWTTCNHLQMAYQLLWYLPSTVQFKSNWICNDVVFKNKQQCASGQKYPMKNYLLCILLQLFHLRNPSFYCHLYVQGYS